MTLMVKELSIKLPYYQGLCSLHQEQYSAGGIALQLYSIPDETDPYPEPVSTCTVCLPEARLGEAEVCIKSWSENAGMMEELQRHNIIGPIKRFVSTGFVTATVHDLLHKLP